MQIYASNVRIDCKMCLFFKKNFDKCKNMFKVKFNNSIQISNTFYIMLLYYLRGTPGYPGSGIIVLTESLSSGIAHTSKVSSNSYMNTGPARDI